MWWEQALVAFDLETTSADPDTARIVSAHLGEIDMIVDPGVPIPPESTTIHGITQTQAEEEGTAAWAAMSLLHAEIVRLVDAGIPIVAFNASYDFTVLDREFRRHEAKAPDEGTWRLPHGLLVIDPYVLDKQVDPYRSGSRKLVDAAKHYGVPLLDAHEAKADADAAVGLARKIGERHPSVGDRDPFALHQSQILWAWAQRKSLEEYFRRSNPDAVVSPYWPVQPWHLAAVSADA